MTIDYLAIARSVPDAPPESDHQEPRLPDSNPAKQVDLNDVHAVWQAALDLLEDDPHFSPKHLEACRQASVRWEDERSNEDGAITSAQLANDLHIRACDRCGSPDYIDVPIHGGRSIRRDCGRCNRVLGWPKWGPDAGPEECLPAGTQGT